MSGFAPLLATGGELAVVYRTAAFLWGKWNASYGDVEAEEFEYGRTLGYVADLDDPPTERGARLWTSADVSIDADGEYSDVPSVFDQANRRTEGDKVLDLTIGREGFGEQVPGEDFHLGDVVPVLLGGSKLVDLPVSEIVFGSVPGDPVGVAARAGGRLLGTSSSLSEQNAQLRAQLVRETNELRNKSNALERVAYDALRAVKTIQQVDVTAELEEARAAVAEARAFVEAGEAAVDEADRLNQLNQQQLEQIIPAVEAARELVASNQEWVAKAESALAAAEATLVEADAVLVEAREATAGVEGKLSEATGLVDRAGATLADSQAARDAARAALAETEVKADEVLRLHDETLDFHGTVLDLHNRTLKVVVAVQGAQAAAIAAHGMTLQLHGETLVYHGEAIKAAAEAAADAGEAAAANTKSIEILKEVQQRQTEINKLLSAATRAALAASAANASAISAQGIAIEKVAEAVNIALQTAQDAKDSASAASLSSSFANTAYSEAQKAYSEAQNAKKMAADAKTYAATASGELTKIQNYDRDYNSRVATYLSRVGQWMYNTQPLVFILEQGSSQTQGSVYMSVSGKNVSFTNNNSVSAHINLGVMEGGAMNAEGKSDWFTLGAGESRTQSYSAWVGEVKLATAFVVRRFSLPVFA